MLEDEYSMFFSEKLRAVTEQDTVILTGTFIRMQYITRVELVYPLPFTSLA
jgi:hypothetical protein